MEKWVKFWLFYSQTFFDHISLVFHHFELIFFLKEGVYMEKRRWGVFGDYCRRRRRHRRRKMGINFRVIKVNLSFGELKIFQMVQKCNRIQLISYILIV